MPPLKTRSSDNRQNIRQSPEDLFVEIASRKGSVWLDSSAAFSGRPLRSFIGTDPFAELVWDANDVTSLRDSGGLRIISRHVLDLIEEIVAGTDQYVCGFFTYEACLALAGVAQFGFPLNSPLARFFVYPSMVTYDHAAESIAFPSNRFQPDIPDRSKSPDQSQLVRWDLEEADYMDRVKKIKEYIHEGDIYQANFTTGMEVPSCEDPFSVYARLRQTSPSAYSAFMNFGDMTILSASPERMLTRTGSQLLTSPIKGTISRGTTAEEELTQRDRLLKSAKDRAELLMIVDLERNDLGAVARTGSVSVDSLFRPEVYSSVIHLVSDISAQLAPGVSLRQLLGAILPGGSVTGAPKRRAMEIIAESETGPRGVYTGCIGYFHRDTIDLNLAIRTITHYDDKYRVHAGGGIVADSDPRAEYDEMKLKMQGMLKALGVQA